MPGILDVHPQHRCVCRKLGVPGLRVATVAGHALAQHPVQKGHRVRWPIQNQAVGKLMHEPVEVVRSSVRLHCVPVASVPRSHLKRRQVRGPHRQLPGMGCGPRPWRNGIPLHRVQRHPTQLLMSNDPPTAGANSWMKVIYFVLFWRGRNGTDATWYKFVLVVQKIKI